MENDLLYIVDDDKVILTYLKGFFRNNGWNPQVFYSAKEMMEALTVARPSLIVTDLDMPEMDGIELIQKLKSDRKFGNIPVLVMTALHENHVRLQSFKAGAIHFVNKPLNPYELEAVVRSILTQFNTQAPAPVMSEAERSYKKDAVESWIDEATEVVLDNMNNEDFSLDELSKALHYSRSAVQKRIKQFTGLSVSKFIRSVRLEKSLEFMREEELPIAIVADRVGFKSHSYFTRCFKEYFGMDPVKKRKELQRAELAA
jgi:YesN/AraC family two-component response regulator